MTFDFAARYDDLNPGDHDYRFYAALAAEYDARRVLDLGCGTGTLAVLLARRGHQVTAVDPDPAMLRVAQARNGADLVTWLLGDSASVETASADLAVMSGHVAQVFLDDAHWARTLADLHRALVPGGVLAFESRNPSARGWERWTRADTLRTVQTDHGPVEFWHETTMVDLPLVTYATVNRTVGTGQEHRTSDTLAFRDETEVVATLRAAGFAIEAICGDWDRSPLRSDSPELILIARRG